MNKLKYSILALLCLLVLQLEVAFGQDDGCAENITFEQNHTFSSEISAESTIESSNSTINPNVNVVFKAGDEITLKDGFVALENSNFRAFNGDASCNSVSFSSGEGICDEVEFDIVQPAGFPDTHNLKFKPLSQHRPTSNNDPPTQYIIAKPGNPNFAPIPRDVMWETDVFVSVPDDKFNEYTVYVNKNCTPPGSSLIDETPIGEVVGPVFCWFHRDQNNPSQNFISINNAVDNEDLPLDFLYDIEVTGAISVTLENIDVAQAHSANDGKVHSPSLDFNVNSANCNCTFTPVNDDTQGGVDPEEQELPAANIAFTGQQNVEARAFNSSSSNTRIFSGEAGSEIVLKAINPAGNPIYVDGFSYSWQITATNGQIIQSFVSTSSELFVCLSAPGTGPRNISFDVTVTDMNDVEISSTDGAVFTVQGSTACSDNNPVDPGSDPGSECVRANSCGVASGNDLSCLAGFSSQINACHPSQWLQKNGGTALINGFENYDPPTNNNFRVGMNLGRLEYYGTMIAYKNLFKMAQQWVSTVANSNGVSNPCDDKILHLNDIINASNNDLIINGLQSNDFGVPNKLKFNFIKQNFRINNPITFDVNGYPNVQLPANNITITNIQDQVSRTFNNVTVKSFLLRFKRENWDVNPPTDLFSNANGGLNIGGEYTIFFDGEGKIKVNGVIVANNTAKFNSKGVFTAEADKHIEVEIIESKLPNYVKNIRIYKNEHNNNVNTFLNGVDFDPNNGTIPEAEKFYDAFINRLGDFPILRFMNWNRTNHSTHRNTSDSDLSLGIDEVDNYYTYAIDVGQAHGDLDCFEEFVSRSHYVDSSLSADDQEKQEKETYLQFPLTKQRGAPYRDIIEIYKAVKRTRGPRDLWINVPHNATNAYIQKMAELFAIKLNNESINIYLEYSNEVWNGGFKQNFDLFNDNSIAHCPIPDTESNIPKALRSYVTKSKNAFDIFENTFNNLGANLNLKRVVAAQHGNPATVAQILRSFLPGEFEVLSVGGYIHPHFNKDDNGNIIGGPGSSLNNNSTVNDIAAATELAMRQRWEGELMQCKRMADCFGAELILYEGGQHITRDQLRGSNGINSGSIVTEQAVLDFDDSPQMRSLYHCWFNFLKNEAEIDGILAYSLATSPDSRHGSWGHLKHTFQNPATSQKYQALMDFVNNPNPANLCCQAPLNNATVCTSPKIKIEEDISSFNVYPNPFSNNLTLKTEKENGTMRIVDMTGRILLQQAIEGQTTTINTKTLKPGYYLVEVEIGGRTQTQKIIKH